ncbi:MAG: hypothetical protein ACLFWB_12590 [Armatimonadota bacterium]
MDERITGSGQDHNISPDPPLWREALIVGLSYYGILTAVPYIRGVPQLPGIMVATVGFLLLSLAVIRTIARWELRWQTELLVFLLTLGLWYALILWSDEYANIAPFISTMASLLFLTACAFFGRLLSRIIRDMNMLLPIAVVLILVDIFTVFYGPTGDALEKAPEVVSSLSVGLPEIGSAAGPEGGKGLAFVATAGLGDFIFLGLFFAATWRYGLRFNRTFWLIFALMAVTMLAFLALPFLPGVPLLPAIAIAFIAANVGEFQFSRQEKVYTLVAVLFIGVLVGAYILVKLLLVG